MCFSSCWWFVNLWAKIMSITLRQLGHWENITVRALIAVCHGRRSSRRMVDVIFWIFWKMWSWRCESTVWGGSLGAGSSCAAYMRLLRLLASAFHLSSACHNLNQNSLILAFPSQASTNWSHFSQQYGSWIQMLTILFVVCWQWLNSRIV